jgi:hypothetical protein
VKWTLSSPDGIGDFLLRLPWLFAAERAGWHLQLVAREPVLEAARLAGLPHIPVSIRKSPYAKATRLDRDPYAQEFSAIRKFDPVLVFFGPSQPTFFEDLAAERLCGMHLGGFVMEGEPWFGECLREPREIARTYDLRVPIAPESSEPARNAAAAARLPGGNPMLHPFRLSPQKIVSLATKSPVLGAPYIVVCVAKREGDYFTGLGEANWIRELRLLESQMAPRFVLAGTDAESASHARILAGLARPGRHLDLSGKIGCLAGLAALLAGSIGYVGKDSGMMHLAGAVGRPVVAVFGGGHWGRFLPVSGPAIALSVKVPCRGCDWRCPFPEPYCAMRLEPGSVAKAWNEMGEVRGSEVRVSQQDLGVPLLDTIGGSGGPAHAAQVHAARRAALRNQRQNALLPFPERLLRRFLATRA